MSFGWPNIVRIRQIILPFKQMFGLGRHWTIRKMSFVHGMPCIMSPTPTSSVHITRRWLAWPLSQGPSCHKWPDLVPPVRPSASLSQADWLGFGQVLTSWLLIQRCIVPWQFNVRVLGVLWLDTWHCVPCLLTPGYESHSNCDCVMSPTLDMLSLKWVTPESWP